MILDKKILEQGLCYKYLGSWITEDASCEEKTKTKIAMAKEAFWKNKTMLK